MSLTAQLRTAFENTGWSVQELLDRSGLAIDRSSLARKLSGDLPLKVTEAEALAKAIRRGGHEVVLAWPPKGHAA